MSSSNNFFAAILEKSMLSKKNPHVEDLHYYISIKFMHYTDAESPWKVECTSAEKLWLFMSMVLG